MDIEKAFLYLWLALGVVAFSGCSWEPPNQTERMVEFLRTGVKR